MTVFARSGVRFLFVLFLSVALAGCGGTSSSGGGNGRSLSEVMTKKDAEQQEEARRRGEGATRTRTHSEPVVSDSGNEGSTRYHGSSSDYDDGSATYEDVTATASFLGSLFGFLFSGEEDEENGGDGASYRETGDQAENKNNLWVGYRYSWSYLAGDAIQGFRTGEVRMGLRKPGGFMGYLGVSVGRGTLDRADLEEAISDLGELGFALGVCSFVTPASSIMGLYYDAGLRFGETRWDYREPLPVPTHDGGEVLITEDSVFEGGPYVGLGLAIVRTGGFHLGAGVLAGMRWRSGKTTEGFANDLFQDVGYYQWNLEAVLHF